MNSTLRNDPNLEALDKRYLFHPFTALADHERNGQRQRQPSRRDSSQSVS